jgi:hypothetical protein
MTWASIHSVEQMGPLSRYTLDADCRRHIASVGSAAIVRGIEHFQR